tara:strand:- start:1361 stop:1759 length:399 start_codon:yes stop_codon:yes gene_type:complete
MKVELTDIEIIHIMNALKLTANKLREKHSISGDMEQADLADELEEIEFDLFEAVNRRDDDWLADRDDPTDLMGQTLSEPDAALSFVQAGIDAREQVKGSSMAAQRREEQVKRMMKGTATPRDPDFMNDPVDW